MSVVELNCFFTAQSAVKCVIEKCYSGLPKARQRECVHLGVLITWYVLWQIHSHRETHKTWQNGWGGGGVSLPHFFSIDFTQLPAIAQAEGKRSREEGRPAKCLEKHFSGVKHDNSIASSAKQLQFSHRVRHKNLDAHQLFQSGKWEDYETNIKARRTQSQQSHGVLSLTDPYITNKKIVGIHLHLGGTMACREKYFELRAYQTRWLPPGLPPWFPPRTSPTAGCCRSSDRDGKEESCHTFHRSHILGTVTEKNRCLSGVNEDFSGIVLCSLWC